MSINYTNLVAQGRAKAIGRPWLPEELEALLTLERECKISRTIAADYIRNGIITVEDYKKAQEVEFIPKTLDEATAEAEKVLKEAGQKAIADVEIKAESVKKDEAEVEPKAEVKVLGKTSTGKKKTK